MVIVTMVIGSEDEGKWELIDSSTFCVKSKSLAVGWLTVKAERIS